MRLVTLKLRDVRNYRRLDLDLGPGLNLFYGENAQGKTNLLEAAGFLGSLRSFRGVKGQALIAWGAASCRISGEVASDTGGGHGRLQIAVEDGRRKALVDGKRPRSAKEYLGVLKTACFSPEDLFLVKEYPSHRRRFLDRSIFHLKPGYIDTANGLRAAMKQMNAALKAGDQKVVEAYEEALAPLAAEVIMARRAQAESIAALAGPIYADALGAGELGVVYRTAATGGTPGELEVSLRALFEKKRRESLRRGHLISGPHADDLTLTLSGRDLRAGASRGQSRLALLALTLADAGLYRREKGESPVLLLDDAASELDARRKGALMELVSETGQALLTATDPKLLDGREGLRFKVSQDENGAGVLLG